MRKNPALFVTKISWRAVAAQVSEITGKRYDPQYVREVASGYRKNQQLKPVLNDLGVLQTRAA